MWELANGPVPEGMNVCHSCDNPACCNPNHLWIGTQQDNVRDRGEKRRTYAGDRWWSRLPRPSMLRNTHRRMKFSEIEIEAIRKMRDEDWLLKDIAKQFGCSRQTVLNICNARFY
jgi:hypothetical protein